MAVLDLRREFLHSQAKDNLDQPATLTKLRNRVGRNVWRFAVHPLAVHPLSTGHPLGGGCMSQELPQSLSESHLISIVVQH